MRDVADTQIHEIAAARLTIDGQVEQGEIADGMGILQVDSDRPDIFWLQRWLLADELSLVPGFAFRVGFPDRLLGCGSEFDCSSSEARLRG